MPQVKVWNDNIHPYQETFKEIKILIPPKGYVQMEEDEAIMFRGSLGDSAIFDADGNPDPRGYKMIRLEYNSKSDTNAAPKVNPPTCQACAFEAASEKDLSDHVQATHAHQIAVDAEAERAIAEKKRARKSA
jgi:hypothetical protein